MVITGIKVALLQRYEEEKNCVLKSKLKWNSRIHPEMKHTSLWITYVINCFNKGVFMIQFRSFKKRNGHQRNSKI